MKLVSILLSAAVAATGDELNRHYVRASVAPVDCGSFNSCKECNSSPDCGWCGIGQGLFDFLPDWFNPQVGGCLDRNIMSDACQAGLESIGLSTACNSAATLTAGALVLGALLL